MKGGCTDSIWKPLATDPTKTLPDTLVPAVRHFLIFTSCLPPSCEETVAVSFKNKPTTSASKDAQAAALRLFWQSHSAIIRNFTAVSLLTMKNKCTQFRVVQKLLYCWESNFLLHGATVPLVSIYRSSLLPKLPYYSLHLLHCRLDQGHAVYRLHSSANAKTGLKVGTSALEPYSTNRQQTFTRAGEKQCTPKAPRF